MLYMHQVGYTTTVYMVLDQNLENKTQKHQRLLYFGFENVEQELKINSNHLENVLSLELRCMVGSVNCGEPTQATALNY